MNKDVEQHLQELIDFYSSSNINDVEYLKKLLIRNLKDVQRRYVKYDKPRKQNWNDLKKFLESNWESTQDIWFVKIIDKMNELEK